MSTGNRGSMALVRVLLLDNDRSRRLVAWLAAAWLVAWILIDLATRRQDVTFVVLFAVAPLIASAVAGWRLVTVFAIAAFLLALASPAFDTGLTWNAHLYAVRVVDVALVGGAAVAIALVRSARESQLDRITEVAAAAQEALLPTLRDDFPGLRIATRYRSASRSALIGGDFFDAVQLPGRTRLVIGDVRGKGLPSVAHAARAIRAFRFYAGSQPDLAGVARGMSGYLGPFLAEEDFITALLVESVCGRSLTMVSCGHPAPVLRSTTGVGSLAVDEHPPLGVPERFGLAVDYRESTTSWAPGDRLLLCTDGLLEARSADGSLLPEARIAGAMQAGSVAAVVDELADAVDQHTGGSAGDDLALLVLENVAVVTEGERLGGGGTGDPAHT